MFLQIITLQCVKGYKQKNPTYVGLDAVERLNLFSQN